jgi:hypothetical protein
MPERQRCVKGRSDRALTSFGPAGQGPLGGEDASNVKDGKVDPWMTTEPTPASAESTMCSRHLLNRI